MSKARGAVIEALVMRYALQTIIWGPAPRDLRGVLRFAKRLGFEGIEFFQHPDVLVQQFGSAAGLKDALAEEGLILAGLTLGSLEERAEFCEPAGLRPEYLYVDDNAPQISAILGRGYAVALHPYVYKVRNISKYFDEVLPKEPRLRVILDPAHLVVEGIDPLQWLEKVLDRLIAVHVKDWAPWFGRSFHRYGQGFTELGRGIVKLPEILDWLRQRKFSGWLVLEQNSKTGTPESSICQSVEWLLTHLNGHSPLRRSAASPAGGQPESELPPAIQPPAVQSLAAGHAAFFDTLLRSQEAPDVFPDVVVRAVAEWARCRFVSLWAHCPLQGYLTLVASHPIRHPIARLEVDRCLSGVALERKRITFLDRLTEDHGRRFRCPELIEQFGLHSAWCVPIVNQHNPNDVGMLLTLYPETALSAEAVELLPMLARYIGTAAERILTDRCVRATGAVQELFSTAKTRQAFFEHCLQIILREVDCEAVSIFMENAYSSNRLELAATTGIKWQVPPPQQFYERGHGRTGKVWDENFEYISIGPKFLTDDPPKSEEICETPRRSYLFGLIRTDSGRAIGVVRCRNKKPRRSSPQPPQPIAVGDPEEGESFSQYDATVLMAICEAMVPRLLLFEAEGRAFRSLLKLTHELKMPLIGVKSQLDFIEHEAYEHQLKFREDWIKESRDSLGLMGTLVENTEYSVRHRDPHTPPESFKSVLLLREIIAPVVDQMAYQLKRQRLPPRSIDRGGVTDIPRLWVQPKALSQVFFNLLNNAIKYRFRDPKAFHAEIVGEESAEHFLVRVRNFGPGVEEHEKNLIFEMGVRGAAASKYDVSGSGYGLSIAREIMRYHGGDLWLTNLTNPTEFTLAFPKSLAQRPPSPR